MQIVSRKGSDYDNRYLFFHEENNYYNRNQLRRTKMRVTHDSHPGRHHEGLELTPVLVFAPGYSDEYRFFTGLQLEEVVEQGMFREWTQPIQQVIPLDTKLKTCLFTMSNAGQITSEQIKVLKERGHCVVNEDEYYRIEVFL
jgi:hypothetical protein